MVSLAAQCFTKLLFVSSARAASGQKVASSLRRVASV